MSSPFSPSTPAPALAPSATYREAAKILRCSEKTLWTLVQARRIRHYKIGSRVLFRLDALAEFMAAGGTATVKEVA